MAYSPHNLVMPAGEFQWTLESNLTMAVPGTMPAGPWDQWAAEDQFSKVTLSVVVRLVMGATLRTVTWWNNITWLTPTDGINWIGREGARN